MRFLCDQMLTRLGRWLRAAGYDTVIVDRPQPDREILDFAIQEDRYLISRDRHFLDFTKGQDHIIYLKSNMLQDCIDELNEKLTIDWTFNLFSRCLICNTEFQVTEPDETVPEGVINWCKEYWKCSNCNKIFWQGSHTKQMTQKLIDLNHR